MLIDLYKKKIWNDAKTVNIIASGCFSKISKVIALALHFFSGKDVEEDEDDSDSEVNFEKIHYLFQFVVIFFSNYNNINI